MEIVGLKLELSAVIFRDADCNGWIAQCLQMDVVAEGDSAQEAAETLMQLCDVQIKACLDDGNIEGIFRPAPAEVWSFYAKAQRTINLQEKPAAVEEFRIREYAPAA